MLTHVYVYLCILTCMYAYMCIFISGLVYTDMYAHLHVDIFICVITCWCSCYYCCFPGAAFVRLSSRFEALQAITGLHQSQTMPVSDLESVGVACMTFVPCIKSVRGGCALDIRVAAKTKICLQLQ